MTTQGIEDVLATTNIPSVEESGTTETNSATMLFKVGENSVYTSVDSLYNGAIEKEKLIARLKSEAAEMQQKLSQLSNKANVKEQLMEMQNTLSNPQQIIQQTENTTSLITEDKVKDLALQAFQQQQAELQRNVAIANTNAKLHAVFGADAESKLNAKAAEIGMTAQDLLDMSVKSPKAFDKLLGFSDSTKNVDPIFNNIASQSFTPPVQNVQQDVGAIFRDSRAHTDSQFVSDLIKKVADGEIQTREWVWKGK